MNTKVKGNLLLNAEIIKPETVYAVFDDGLIMQARREISMSINYGSKMLQIYEHGRDNLHVVSVVDMLMKMEDVFLEFSQKRYDSRRGVNNEHKRRL